MLFDVCTMVLQLPVAADIVVGFVDVVVDRSVVDNDCVVVKTKQFAVDVVEGDVVAVREKSKTQLRIKNALEMICFIL